MKTCTRCGASKPLDDFYSDKTKSDGRSTRCKECIKLISKTPEVRARANKNRRIQYADNPDLFHDRNRKWRAENQDAVNKRSREWAAANPEKKKAISDKYRLANAEAIRDTNRAKAVARYRENPEQHREASRRYRAANKDLVQSKYKEWGAKNRHIQAKHCMKRHVTKLQNTPKWANDFAIQEMYLLAKSKESELGGKWHVDHIVPLRSKIVCGLHCEANLQVIPMTDNLRKNNRYWPDMP